MRVRRHDQDSQRNPAASQSGPAQVLLVEDNGDAAESMALLLELLGHCVRIVQDGPSALEAARASVPDVALLDIGLPGMSGYDVARSFRADPRFAGVMLVALTGYGQYEDRARALEAGFDRHLVKPIDGDTLQRVVADAMLRPRRSAPASLH
jgi:CheY-like chemotaxis protein